MSQTLTNPVAGARQNGHERGAPVSAAILVSLLAQPLQKATWLQGSHICFTSFALQMMQTPFESRSSATIKWNDKANFKHFFFYKVATNFCKFTPIRRPIEWFKVDNKANIK